MSTSQNSNNKQVSSGLPPLPPDYLERKKDHHYFLGWAVTRNQLADIGGPVGGMMHIAAESKRKPIYIAYAIPVFEDDPVLSEREKKWLKIEEERASIIIMTYCDHGRFRRKYKLPSARQVDAISALLGGRPPAWYRDVRPKRRFNPSNFE